MIFKLDHKSIVQYNTYIPTLYFIQYLYYNIPTTRVTSYTAACTFL